MFKLNQVLQCAYDFNGRGLICVVEGFYRDSRQREMVKVRFVRENRIETYSLVYLNENFKAVKL